MQSCSLVVSRAGREPYLQDYLQDYLQQSRWAIDWFLKLVGASTQTFTNHACCADRNESLTRIIEVPGQSGPSGKMDYMVTDLKQKTVMVLWPACTKGLCGIIGHPDDEGDNNFVKFFYLINNQYSAPYDERLSVSLPTTCLIGGRLHIPLFVKVTCVGEQMKENIRTV